MATQREVVFEEVCSQDFLQFKFGERGYQDQLNDSIAKTEALAAVKVEIVKISLSLPGEPEEVAQEIVWVAHNFSFLGGSLGCAEGEKITRAFELALEKRLPVVVQCRSGGARMQEGTSSLMQMAKVSVAVQAHHAASLPFVSVLCDPTYGGVSASYAMQADVRIAVSVTNDDDDANTVSEARIGFAGPAVILNTMCEADQARFDAQCPADFQAASYVLQSGQVDMVLAVPRDKAQGQREIERHAATVARLLTKSSSSSREENETRAAALPTLVSSLSPTHTQGEGNGSELTSAAHLVEVPQDMDKAAAQFNYTRARAMDRPQTQDLLHALFDAFVELSGDGKVGRDASLRGGVAMFHGMPVVVLATFKGHSPAEMENANYGMPSPHGYRTALRLMRLAEKFSLPLITLVDTVGAWPTFSCEALGQSEAIATNLTALASLRVPVISLVVGEGGSGGALGVCVANAVAMLSGAYLGVISPEGAASILGRYTGAAHKAQQFPKDCQALAKAQCIYAHQLKALGVVDTIIWEETDLRNGSIEEKDQNGSETESETYKRFPALRRRVESFLAHSLSLLCRTAPDELVAQRYAKYRALGSFAVLDETQREEEIARAKSAAKTAPRARATAAAPQAAPSRLLAHIAEETVLGAASKHRKLAPPGAMSAPRRDIDLAPAAPVNAPGSAAGAPVVAPEDSLSAKAVLDAHGAEYLCSVWLPRQRESVKRVLVTDTTMRDAHQSLLATRVRTKDIEQSARLASSLLKDAFSLECWGGATFDVCMRFLDECPWARLRALRAACPNVLLQCLVRGANGVGYTSYPDNVVREFISLSAKNGMDVFRVFDCFNIVENMQVAIDAVRESGKVCEVCVCYTGNVLTSSVYDVAYYAALAKECVAAGAHILAIKDMAGLLRPLEVAPLMKALRDAVGENMPIHFHTHATSSGSLATCLEMARCGCDIIDFATASMADGTSQPSLNTFLAMMQGAPNDPKIDYLALEPYDLYWQGIREQYSPFESGMKSGTARVFEHQIPGGQYSNLLVQCAGMGLALGQWAAVLDAYRDVNALFGDVVKVTPSSKVVGDLALYLVLKGLKTHDLIDPVTHEIQPGAWKVDFPQSVVGLLKGELGFPHRGFPKELEELVLKGAPKLTTRAGLVLPPVDFEKNIADLSAKWGQAISAEEAMSSLMYPQVFSDYMTRQQSKGPLLTALPTPVYLYAMAPGDAFDFDLSAAQLVHVLSSVPASLSESDKDSVMYTVRVELQRVSAISQQHRTVSFSVSVFALRKTHDNALHREAQHVRVRDTGGVFVFAGPMADPAKPSAQVASPMGGVVEKVLVSAGDAVRAGDVLCLVSAMKMEVKVTAPKDGVVKAVHVPGPGYRVVEGALLVEL